MLFYALGGGTGHLNRAYALARHLKALRTDLTPLILTSAPIVPPLIQEGISILRVPSPTEHHAAGLGPGWVQHLVKDYQPQVLLVDSHSNGVWQELEALWPQLQAKKIFLRRDERIPPPGLPYDQSWLLTEQADGLVVNRARRELKSRREALALLKAHADLPVVAVVHNGPAPETQSLFLQVYLALKDQPLQLRLISLQPPAQAELMPLWLSYFPLSELLVGIDLILGGGGYNLVTESRVFGKRALFWAFDRPLDQQALRIAPADSLPRDLSPSQLAERVQAKLAQSPPQACEADKTEVLAAKISAFLP